MKMSALQAARRELSRGWEAGGAIGTAIGGAARCRSQHLTRTATLKPMKTTTIR